VAGEVKVSASRKSDGQLARCGRGPLLHPNPTGSEVSADQLPVAEAGVGAEAEESDGLPGFRGPHESPQTGDLLLGLHLPREGRGVVWPPLFAGAPPPLGEVGPEESFARRQLGMPHERRHVGAGSGNQPVLVGVNVSNPGHACGDDPAEHGDRLSLPGSR